MKKYILCGSFLFLAQPALAMDPLELDYKILNDDVVYAQKLSCYEGYKNDNSQNETTLLTTPYKKKEKAQAALKQVVSGFDGGLEDGRVQISHTTLFPYCTCGFMEMEFSNGSHVGSGELVGSRHILTAGHCLYNRELNEWATKIRFFPARNMNNKPFGEANANVLLSVKGWTRKDKNLTGEKSEEYDFGMIILDRDIGKTTGWIGILSAPISFLQDLRPLIHVTGYPKYQPGTTKDISDAPQMYTMATHLDINASQESKKQLKYQHDTSDGQSGSSTWIKIPGIEEGCYSLGIHTYGLAKGEKVTKDSRNSATRINNQKFRILKSWMELFSDQPLKETDTAFENFQTQLNSAREDAEKDPSHYRYLIGEAYHNEDFPHIYTYDNRLFPLHYEEAKKWYEKVNSRWYSQSPECDAKRKSLYSAIGDLYYKDGYGCKKMPLTGSPMAWDGRQQNYEQALKYYKLADNQAMIGRVTFWKNLNKGIIKGTFLYVYETFTEDADNEERIDSISTDSENDEVILMDVEK